MRIKLYNFLVNKHAGIKSRYHRFHDNSTGAQRVLSWIYLLWLNVAYYVLFCRFLGREPGVSLYEEKRLLITEPESGKSPKIEDYIKKLSQYEYISFDIFDTLIFRPFSQPDDLFYLLGQKLGYMDFKRIRTEAEFEARQFKFKTSQTYEVTLEDIWNCMEEKTAISAQIGMKLEQELEMAYCYANPLMQEVYTKLLAMGKKMIIISDMYLSTEFLEKLLQEKGYTGFQKIYVSCDYGKSKGNGALFAQVKEDFSLADKRVVHVGDNEHSDVKEAIRQGFASCYYPNINKNMVKKRPYDMSPIIGGAYRGMVNNHLYSGKYKHTMEYEYGYIYGGLFVVGYCAFIHDYCTKNKVDKILFLSRDGDILRQVYAKMYPEDKFVYVYWSRKVATKLMASSDRYDFMRRFIEHKVNQNLSVEQIFDSMELECLLERLPSSIRRDDALTSTNIKEIKAFFVEHWQEVVDTYAPEHEAAKIYYADVLDGCGKAVAVDIGWAGSGAIALHHLVNEVWDLSCDIIGLLAGTNTVHNAEPDAGETFLQSGQLVSYLYSMSHNRDLLKKHDANKYYNVFWELLLSSPQSQFVGFAWEDDTKQKVAFRFGKKDANQEGIMQVQKGILQFAEEYLEHFKEAPYMLNISGRDAYAPMLVAASRHEKYLKEMKNRFDLVIGVE